MIELSRSAEVKPGRLLHLSTDSGSFQGLAGEFENDLVCVQSY